MALTDEISGQAPGQGLHEIRAPLATARHAPGYVYASDEMLQLEKEKLFMKDWLLMGREEEFANPGDYMTFRILDEPLVIARDHDGSLNAYSNVCAHRGVEVASGSGNANSFSCPYHGWNYDLKGKLIGAAYMDEAEDFNPETCRLAPLRLGTWAGNVFVTFDDEAPSLEEFIAPFADAFSFLHMEECGLAGRLVLEMPCNWKLFVENAMDMYHVGVLHAGTFGAHTFTDPDHVKLKPRGMINFEYLSAPATPDGKTRFGKMPWIEDRADTFATMGYMQPNTQLVARSDQIRPLTVWPLGPDKCQLLMYSLFPKVHLEREDAAERIKVYHDNIAFILEEDRTMVASLQNGMMSANYRPGPMSEMEKPIHHVINGILDRVFGEA